MGGLGRQLAQRDQRVAVLLMNDLLPHSAAFIKASQSAKYGRSRNKAAYETMDAAFQLAMSDPAAGRPLSFDWRSDVTNVEATGTKVHKHAKRGGQYIENMCTATTAALQQSHADYFVKEDIADDLIRLFDWESGLQFWPHCTTQCLDSLYQPTLENIAKHYCELPEECSDQNLLFEKSSLLDEWSCARRGYVSAARAIAPVLLAEKNAALKREVGRRNKLKRKSAPEEFVPLKRVDTEDVLQHILGKTTALKEFPIVTTLAAALITSMYSQARVESMFNYLKMIITAKRQNLAGDKIDMLMLIKLCGPKSAAGIESGLTRGWLLRTAFKVFEATACERKINKAQRAHVHVNDLKGIKPRSDFGRCPDIADGAAEIDAELAKLEAAKKRREAAVALASESAREQLAGQSADRAAVLAGPVDQVDLVSDGAATYIKVVGADGALSLRAPILDIESTEPEVGSEVAVTGFGGNVWFNGTIMSTSHEKGKQLWRILFPFDGKLSDCPLKQKRYGPAKVKAAHGSKPAQVTPGWMFLAPVEATQATAQSSGDCALDTGSSGAPQPTQQMQTDLLTTVYEADCGGTDTVTKLKRAGLFSIDDVKLCSKSDMKEVGINLGNGNRLLRAIAKKRKGGSA